MGHTLVGLRRTQKTARTYAWGAGGRRPGAPRPPLRLCRGQGRRPYPPARPRTRARLPPAARPVATVSDVTAAAATAATYRLYHHRRRYRYRHGEQPRCWRCRAERFPSAHLTTLGSPPDGRRLCGRRAATSPREQENPARFTACTPKPRQVIAIVIQEGRPSWQV